MNKNVNIDDLFKNWNELNIQVQKDFGNFDFAKIKEFRKEQKTIDNDT